jgi:transposase
MQVKNIKKQLKEIAQAKKEEKRSKIYRRIICIEQRLKGKPCKDIAEELGVCLDTVSDWTNIYEEKGLTALRKLNYEGRRVSKLESCKQKIKDYVKEESIQTISELQEWLKKTHSVEAEQSWLFRFCKKNSIFLSKKHA